VRFWVDCDLVHLSVGSTRIKTVRSHLTVADLTRLLAEGARPAGPPPLPTTPGSDGVIEVERVVSRGGTITLGGQVILAAEILGGRQVGVRIEETTLLFFDLQTRELLRTRPNPIPPGKARSCVASDRPDRRPRPSVEPITVQRRASNSGVIMVCGQSGTRPDPSPSNPDHPKSPRPRWPSNSTTARPESSDAPPPKRCVTSKPTGHGRSPQFPSPGVAHHVAEERRESPVGSHKVTPGLGSAPTGSKLPTLTSSMPSTVSLRRGPALRLAIVTRIRH
jgi:hypothetical protein